MPQTRHRSFAVVHIVSLFLLFGCPSFVFSQETKDDKQRDTSTAGNEKVAAIIRTFAGRGVQSDGSKPTPPSEAVERFRMRSGFAIDLVASEPEVSQPLFLTWDSRGRMWVVQYRQYQFPAGLKIVRYDQHLRAVFDKVPEPPPRGTPGLDKITVFEDTNGDGSYDVHKDVITGLNIVSSVQVGHDGIWVLNPPYLLFYPDRDHDDVPDGDPEVHLSGFGLQDTHSVSNSLIWGPDGWLYAVNGSTTTGTVSSAVTKGVGFQGQNVWRYHPKTKIFEIYAEGGGNNFCLDIDSKGRVFTGYNGGNTRGFYFPQGSYSQKNWGKHGPLTNPYAFGFFGAMKSEGDDSRFAQALMIYEGGLFPSEFDGQIIAPNSMKNIVWHSRLIPEGSSYRTIDEPNLVESSDRWFRPVYGGVGPDGGVYMADWYDTRLSHVSPIDDWHKESGRIYRVRPENSKPAYQEGDLRELSSLELIKRFDHRNKWVRKRAMLELGWRGDTSVADQLVSKVEENSSLESLWALNLLNLFSSDLATHWLNHKDPHIRRWTIRLLGDRAKQPTDALARQQHLNDASSYRQLAIMAQTEQDVQVRSQIASTAKRLPSPAAIPVIRALLTHSEDVEDIHMPLMNWWALEAHATDFAAIQKLVTESAWWELPLVQHVIGGRLMQRYAAAGTPADLERCARLVEFAPDAESREQLILGLNRAFQGRKLPELPSSLDAAFAEYQATKGEAGVVVALRQGKQEDVANAIEKLQDHNTDLGIRIELAKAFGTAKHVGSVGILKQLATSGSEDTALRRVAIQSLALYEDDSIARHLASGFGGSISPTGDLRVTGYRTLAGRKSWAKILLREFSEWRLHKEEVPPDVLQRLRTYKDPELVATVKNVFGKPATISSPEKVAEIQRLLGVLSNATGNADAGKVHFDKNCAICHRLFGEGKQIGPPLDAYDRGNAKFWLPAIIEPSLEIREGYQSYAVTTLDGRTITGMIAAQGPKSVTMRTADDQMIILSRDDIDELGAITTSLMPEGSLKDLTDEQIADLFAYLSLGTKRHD